MKLLFSKLASKMYDVHGGKLHVISEQELWHFFASKSKMPNRENVDIYILVEYFVQHHPEGNFVTDDDPFLKGSSYKIG